MLDGGVRVFGWFSTVSEWFRISSGGFRVEGFEGFRGGPQGLGFGPLNGCCRDLIGF